MSQVIRCPHCASPIRIADNSGGKQFRCPLCRKPFLVPADPTLAECPACRAPLTPGAIACLECGYLMRSEDASGTEEDVPNLCPNPACGVANPLGERNCQRCSTLLPHPPGTMLHARFHVERLLAMGGFGAVYLATDTKHHNRPVAIQHMTRADPQEFAILRNFFRREAEFYRLLQSAPVIPRFHGLVEDERSACLVMEYFEGRNLAHLLEERGNRPFPTDQVIAWAECLADLLVEAHACTPPLIGLNFAPEHFVLLDDGHSIRRAAWPSPHRLNLARRTVRPATPPTRRPLVKYFRDLPGYVAPEEKLGQREARSDLFTLACALYELATGEDAQGDDSAAELVACFTPDGPYPAEVRWFFRLLGTNLAEDPDRRSASARDFRRILQDRGGP